MSNSETLDPTLSRNHADEKLPKRQLSIVATYFFLSASSSFLSISAPQMNLDPNQSPEPQPTHPARKSYWVLRIVKTTIVNGGWLTPKLYAPKEVWTQVSRRMCMCVTLTFLSVCLVCVSCLLCRPVAFTGSTKWRAVNRYEVSTVCIYLCRTMSLCSRQYL